MFTALYKIGSIRALALASVFSLFVGSMAQAGGSPTGHGAEWHSGVGSHIIGDSQKDDDRGRLFGDRDACPVVATEGAPGGPGDGTSHAEVITDTHRTLATEGPPKGVTDHNDRKRDTHMMFAGGKASAGTNPVGDHG